MTDLTAVDIMIQPDPAAITRARAVNARMPLSIQAGITLDDTHLPHITMCCSGICSPQSLMRPTRRSHQ